MELLIPGFILVGLMVYLSTRIKRSAAAAFAAETIDNDDFVIEKPEGFLAVIGGDPKYAFESYSKENGVDEASRFRMANAHLTIKESGSVDDVIADIRSAENEIVEDVPEVVGSQHYRVVETKRKTGEVDLNTLYKIAAKDGRIYVFEIERLANASEEFKNKTDLFLNSFTLK